MNALSKYLYVISLDGLSTLDFQYISTLPNFKNFLSEASYCKNVCSVYPTLTYPAHVSIVTGKYPKNHGVVNNTLLQPNKKSPDWYWYRDDIEGTTFYDLAIEKGMKVGALLWPVTAKSKIQYNMPEIFANRFWKNQTLVSLLNGTPLFQYELNKKFGYLRNGIRQPNLDNFVHQSLLYTIENKCLDLTLVHYTDLDSTRHYNGFNSKEAILALKRHDKRIGEIVQALKEKGIYEESTIIILGDHSSLDSNKIINPNVLLKDKGYIKVNSKGKIIDYKVIFKSCDGCGYLYLKEDNFEILEEIIKLIKDFNRSYECIENIYSREEASQFGADKSCSLMIEAKPPYYFKDEILGEVIEEFNGEELQRQNGCKLCNHGYSPFRADYTTIFIISGRGVKKGAIVEKMDLVDEGPTIARLLGVELKDIDGRVLEELLDENPI